MIIGEYPCCGEALMIEVPNTELPKFCNETCEHCGVTVWHRLSRIEPASWTEEDFLKLYDVDYENKTIEDKKNEPT